MLPLLLFDVERLTALVGVLGDLGDFGVLEEVDWEGVVEMGGGVAAAFLFERVVTILLTFVLLGNAFAVVLVFFSCGIQVLVGDRKKFKKLIDSSTWKMTR